MRWLVPVNVTNDSEIQCIWKTVRVKWDAAQVIDFLLTGPLLTVTVFIGVVTGFLCILTFARSFKNMRIYIYLLALAAWDVFYVLTSFLLYNLPTLLYIEIPNFGQYAVGTPFLYYISTVARAGAVWTVLIIAFERYVALCHPFRFEKINSDRRVGVMFATIAVFAFVYCLPRYFEMFVLYCNELTTHERVPLLAKSYMRSTFAYWLLYRVIGGGLFYSLVPFIALIVLTMRISFEISKCADRLPSIVEASFTSPDRTLLNCTTVKISSTDRVNHWMHVAMITKFLLCHSFPMILDIWELVQPAIAFDKQWQKSWVFMSHSSLFLLALNGSCNLFIYYSTSTKFRADLRASLSFTKFARTPSYY